MVKDKNLIEMSQIATEKAKNFQASIKEADDKTVKYERTDIKVISAVKKIVFDEKQSTNLNVDGANKLKNYSVLIDSIKYIVENIMGLTPEEYDAIYSTKLNQDVFIDHAIRKLVINAPSSISTEALFDAKKILFRLCWPDYYAEHYKKPQAWDIFNASGEIKSNLIRAGRIKENSFDIGDIDESLADDSELEDEPVQNKNGKFSVRKQERKRTYNHGEEVDKLVYWSMNTIFSLISISTEDLYTSLANIKDTPWSNYGFVQIIEARNCYETPLDFYFLNSSQNYQLEHVEEYMKAREEAGLEHYAILDWMYEAYRTSVEEGFDY